MAVLIDERTTMLFHGANSNAGRYHLGEAIAIGTRVVAGVSPGKGGGEIGGLPNFESVAEAVAGGVPDAALLMTPARFAVDAAYECLDAGIRLIIMIAEGVPVHDTLRLIAAVRARGARLVGPNTPGLLAPGRAKGGLMPMNAFSRGPVGMVSRSGTLSYETAKELTRAGIGQSSFVGVGGDSVRGTSIAEVLDLMERDPETEAIVLIGEIGGNQEEVAAERLRRGFTKPVVAYIAGEQARPGRTMGHAGALVTGGVGAYADKVAALAAAGAVIATSPADVAIKIASLLSQRKPTP
ncbi:MAG: succinate--CoA ligase subunit alpha [Alphaproteobacteria bacterium]|nr:succinate--CoA ligase subunit alpha [Alphaproteobacteria bacterium]